MTRNISCDAEKAPIPMNETVSFTAWIANGLDRYAVPRTDLFTDGKMDISPREVTIRRGGTIRFIFGQAHVLAIYGPGTKPSDIDVSQLVPAQCPPYDEFGPIVIDDANNRIYRGLDPSCLDETVTDRAEVVTIDTPGRYLMICAIVTHFVEEKMYGYINVV